MKMNGNILKKIYIAAIIAIPVVAIVLAMVLLLPNRIAHFEAKKLIDEKQYYDATEKLLDICESDNRYYDAMLTLLDAYMSIGNYDRADIVLNAIDVDKLSSKDAELFDKHLSHLNNYYYTINEVSKLWDSDDFDVTRDNLKAMFSESRYMQSVIYWYLCGTSETAQESIDYLKSCIEKDTRYLSAYLALGNLYRTIGDIDNARTIYKAALEIDATDCGGLYGLAVLELLEGDKSLALSKLRDVYAMYGKVNFIPEALALALFETGNDDEAEDFITTLEKEEYIFSTAFENCSLGIITLEEYYMPNEQSAEEN